METLLIVCSGLALSAVVGGMIGQAKGQAGAGVALGLLLGPIGWLVVFLQSDPRPRCPLCGGVIVPGARKCKNCGSDLPQPPKVDLVVVQGAVRVGGRTFIPLSGADGEAFCFVCRRVSPKNGMLKAS